jgi:hypothetical protein
MGPLFNTFSYQPLMAAAFSNNPALPENIERAVNENPDKAAHIESVWQFTEWMKKSAPDFYKFLDERKPQLLDAPKVVTSGKLGAIPGDYPSTVPGGGFDGLGQDAAAPADQGVLTQWGTQMLDLAKGYMVYDAQKDLMAVNISRAERGLPPIDPGVIAPQVQVGIAPNVQTLMYVALAGLVLFGLVSAFGRRAGK